MPSPSKRKTLLLVTVFCLLTLTLLPANCFAASHDYSYKLLDSPGGSKQYTLTVSITDSLNDYYSSQDHNLYSYDFSKFVTPDALQPVADDLWSIYSSDEDFANGVLMLVHQIPYVESSPQKYPIETIIENEGDCDLFTIIAASIMKAGGLDVVMLLLDEQEHMLLGVYLPESPKDARTTAYFYTYDSKKYYVAETTGGLWETGWRVGECPDTVQGSTAQIIPLRNYERVAPAQVASSYSSPETSSIYMSISSNFVVSANNVEITGNLLPSLAGKTVTLYVSSMGSPLTKLATVVTDSLGHYTHIWQAPTGGIYTVRANWSGDEDYSGSDSTSSQLIVIPFEGLLVGGVLLVFVLILVIVTLATRENRQQNKELFQAIGLADLSD
ncbi:MAG: Ig-like domain-containing protein [Candidatus Bathyarchaeia archaeon]